MWKIGQEMISERIVITGATSSIGLHLVDRLSSGGAEVICLVRPGSLKNDYLSKYENVKMVECSLDQVDERLSNRLPQCDYFFNIGWIKPTPDTKNNPEHLINVAYSENSARLAVALGCKTFVGVGSQSECGNNPNMISSSSPSNPECNYALAKVKSVESTSRLCKESSINCIWPRLLSSYGPYDRNNTLIMNCIRACYRDEAIELTPCEQKWDYIYSSDVADALIAIAEKGMNGKRYPIATGHCVPLKRYVETIAKVFNKDITHFGIGKREYSPDQCMHLCANITDLEEDTGFHPTVSFEEGIRRMKKWADETGYFIQS